MVDSKSTIKMNVLRKFVISGNNVDPNSHGLCLCSNSITMKFG
jgi:hypothetical protein